MIDLQEKKRISLAAIRRRLGKVQLSVACGTTVVWMLLFHGFQMRKESLGLLVLGFLVSLLIMLLFPLPPITPGFRLRPLSTVRLVLHVFTEMVLASFWVTVQTFRPGEVRNSVIAVPMRTDSDLMLVCTAIASSIIPGTVIIEATQSDHTLYVHVLSADNDKTLEESRLDIWELEERFVMAMGTREDIAELRASEPVGKGGA